MMPWSMTNDDDDDDEDDDNDDGSDAHHHLPKNTSIRSYLYCPQYPSVQVDGGVVRTGWQPLDKHGNWSDLTM